MARSKASTRAKARRARSAGSAPAASSARATVEAFDAGRLGSLERDARAAAPEREGLSVTHWFDPGTEGPPFTATVRFTGRRLDVRGKPGTKDEFARDETVEGVVPGSGPVSVTAFVHGVNPGQWTVSAELIRGPAEGSWRRALRSRPHTGTPLPRAGWSWSRWSLATGAFAPVRTRWGPLVRFTPMPAVVPGSWSALVGLGILVGIVIQSALLAGKGMPLGDVLLVDAAAVVAGFIGANLWYIALRPSDWRRRFGGLSVDGSLVAAPVAGVAAMIAVGLPIGAFLDASTPAFFFGMAIGRFGCFLTGCCAGRCTAAPWGVWSSDRRVGARRVPAQLIESAAALLFGAATLPLVLGGAAAPAGAIFIGGAAAYVLVRHWLLPLRAEPRQFSKAAPLTAAAAALVLMTDATVLIISAV